LHLLRPVTDLRLRQRVAQRLEPVDILLRRRRLATAGGTEGAGEMRDGLSEREARARLRLEREGQAPCAPLERIAGRDGGATAETSDRRHAHAGDTGHLVEPALGFKLRPR